MGVDVALAHIIRILILCQVRESYLGTDHEIKYIHQQLEHLG